ncbi:MAG: hypothetical protein OES57_11595, partial [Acidimicrobiia bacterium]|nr:hypothetical protein [Acidimicrobiia bacterium]
MTTDRGRRGTDAVFTPRTRLRRGVSRLHPRLPARVAARDWRPAIAALRGQPSADVVWVMQPDLVGAGIQLPPGPLVVDLVDLEDAKYQGDGFSDRWQLRRWRALQQAVFARADAVAVAHPGEAATIAHPCVAVLPNAVDVPVVDAAAGRPTLTLVGRFTYQPNAEAARWMVTEVLPLIRAERPDVELRLVGRHDGVLDDIGGAPGVE